MKLSRKARILTAVIAVLILIPLLLVLGVRAYVRLPHLGYYHKSERAFKIPGLGDGFVPQGIDYDTERNTYLVTGYDKAGGQSPLYLVGDDGKLQKTLHYTLADGTAYTGHAGGIAVGGDFVYLAGGADATVHVFARADLEKTQDGGAITAVGSLSCYLEENKDDHLGPAFLQVSDGNLIDAGEPLCYLPLGRDAARARSGLSARWNVRDRCFDDAGIGLFPARPRARIRRLGGQDLCHRLVGARAFFPLHL